MTRGKQNNNIALIKKAINNDKLVVFAGAGVSKDSGLPLWGELIQEIKGFLNEDIEEDDPLKIAQFLYNEKGEKEYNDIIKDALYRNIETYTPLHELIFELNPQHIITTNYDYFFEDVINNKGLPFSVVSKDIDLPYAGHKNLLIKYHGDFQNQNIVFKETDYLEFSKNHTLKEIFVKSLFSNKVILFIGYSVGDINLKLLIRDIQFILNKHHQRAYFLSHKESLSSSQIKYFENLGINIISYDHEQLKDLNDNAELSPTGQIVHKQLEFIKDFDLYEYERRKDNVSTQAKIIDDMYTSLYRFEYFRVLPKKFLASLYPFNKNSKDDTYYNVESNTLVCHDNELHSLLKKYKGENDDDFTNEEKCKLNSVFARLMYSNIYYIGKKTGRKDSFDNKPTGEIIDLSTKYYSEHDNCDCINCSIENLKYSDAILKIEEYKITNDSRLWDDLVFAYALYQLAEYYNSFKAYELIEIKSNRQKRMDVSFICAYNMKRLGLRITNLSLHDHRYSFENLTNIKIQATKIDLDKSLDRVKYFVDKDVFNLLKEIHNGIYIQELCNNIEKNYIRVLHEIKIIKNGGSATSSSYFNLHNTTRELTRFLEQNFIIGNGFSTTQKSINKSIKAFILGFYVGTLKIPAHQSEIFGISKLDSFDHFLFEQIINYNEPKELVNFIREHNLSDIKFDKESQESVFILICDFFKSSYKVHNLFNDISENTVFINYLSYNNNFKYRIIHQFNNLCIVLTYFKFSEDQIKQVYSDINKFIKYTKFNERDVFELFENLIDTKYSIIGYDLLIDTLDIFNSKQSYNHCYVTILLKLKELNNNFINNNIRVDLINLENIKYESVFIYHTLDANSKKQFLKRIEQNLEEKFDTSTVFMLLIEKIPVKKDIKIRYIEAIHNKLKDLREITKEDYTNHYRLDPFVQYFELVYLNKLDNSKLSSLNIKNEIFKFTINPENYDKSKFDVTWLKVFHYDIFLQRFAKIDYIIKELELYLINNSDKKLNTIYFKLKKYTIKEKKQ
ncbi:SIR2 family protein [Myroides sp. LJL119]